MIKSISEHCKLLGRAVVMLSLAGSLCGMAMSLVDLAFAGYLQVFLRSIGLAGDAASVDFPIVNQMALSLGWLIVLLTVLGVLKAMGQFVAGYCGSLSLSHITRRFRLLTVYEMLLHPHQQYVPAAITNYRLTEIFPKAGKMGFALANLLSSSVQSFSLAFFLLLISWQETLIGFSGLIIIGTCTYVINKRVRIFSAQIPIAQAKMSEGIERIARNWFLVKVLRTQKKEYNNFLKFINNYHRFQIKTDSLVNLSPVVAPTFGIPLLMGIVYGSVTVIHTSPMVLLSFLYVFLRFIQSTANSAKFVSTINQILPQYLEAKKYFDSFDFRDRSRALQGKIQPIPKVQLKKLAIKKTPPAISIRNLSFCYPGTDQFIIKNLSLEIPSGQQFAIVGRSGSGKSTLLALILGTLEPTAGEILIDGMKASEFFVHSCIPQGYVGPDPFLISGTIADNLRYGSDFELSDDDMWHSLNKAHIDKKIADLPAQLNFKLEEDASGLSAGEKQRLSLARALVNDPLLLILDEVSANLDIKTEIEITESLKERLGHCTTIIVSHRKEILKYCKFILDLDNFGKHPIPASHLEARPADFYGL